MNYLNEIDPYAANHSQNLIDAGEIPPAIIDRRSIADVQPGDLDGYNQCHFFAGISGWPLALKLAGVSPDFPVWTGSCPCQPFSAAGKKKGKDDERHLWPEFFRLIKECRPRIVFGEQVAGGEVIGTLLEAAFVAAIQSGNNAKANELAEKIARKAKGQMPEELSQRWFDGICADFESAGYSCESLSLCAAGIGAPQIRQRLYWVAVAGSPPSRNPINRKGSCESDGKENSVKRSAIESGRCCGVSRLGFASTEPRHSERDIDHAAERNREPTGTTSTLSGLGLTSGARLEERSSERRDDEPQQPTAERTGGEWSDYEIIHMLDGKSRRIESGSFALAHGLPRSVGPDSTREQRMELMAAKANRVGRLRGYGNAIVPGLAAQFIRDALDSIAELTA